MTEKGKQLPHGDSENLPQGEPQSTGLISRESIVQRLKRGKDARTRFLESHLNKSLAFQIRSLRDAEGWTQAEFAEKLGIGHANNVSARLENPKYGKQTLTTLKKIAATCDVGLVVWFVPWHRLASWASGTPYTDLGLSPGFYNIPPFHKDPELSGTHESLGRVEDVKDKEDAQTGRRLGLYDDFGSFIQEPKGALAVAG